MKQVFTRFFGFLIALIFLGSCVGTRHLEDGEKLLYKQSISGVDKAERDKLSREILLKPNLRIPLIGALGANLYERGENNLDTAKIGKQKRAFVSRIDEQIASRKERNKKTNGLEAKKRRKVDRYNNQLRNGNFLMRTGTPLAVYDSSQIERSRLRILDQLQDDGYFKAEVSVEVKEKKRKITQTFVVEAGERRFIDSLNLRTGDEAISKLINDSRKKSFLKQGAPYLVQNMEKERRRINELLRNNGYFEMTESFISFEVRLAPDETDLWVTTIVNKPAKKPDHVAYSMDSIIFNTNGSAPVSSMNNYQDIQYTYGVFDYSAKVLDTRVIFRPGQVYNY